MEKRPGLYANMNRRKKLGISRPKSKSTISSKAYRFMKMGFKKQQVEISETCLTKIIREYTHEAGVRGLEKEIATICRKIALKIAYGEKMKQTNIILRNLQNYLGIEKYKSEN